MGLKNNVRIINTIISAVKVETYVLGKYKQGESAAMLIYINNNLYYTMIIDSCDNDLENLKKYIFTPNNINKVDFICWTHPHEDHTKGIINLIKNYSKEKTILLIPNELNFAKQKLTRTSSEVYMDINSKEFEINESIESGVLKETIDYVDKNNLKRERFKGDLLSSCDYTPINKITYVDTLNTEVKMNINSYSPIYNILSTNFNNNRMRNNDFAIMLEVDINGSKFIFGSDVENVTINRMKDKYDMFSNVKFVKIPHHGGKSSEKFVDLIEDDDGVKCFVSTVYSNKNLTNPTSSVLDLYRGKKGNIYCTNEKHFKPYKDSEDFGIIKTEYEFMIDNGKVDGVYLIEVSKYGDAFQYNSL